MADDALPAAGTPGEDPFASGARHVGLWGATMVGVGAIVGGGILVLAGVAFEEAGPAAVIAFGLNGIVAFLTAMSFAEMSSSFPQSGGAYLFAKKVLSVRAAFASGWILWFAYIVAGVLYALGFASYAVLAIRELWAMVGEPPLWLGDRRFALFLGTAASVYYTVSLIRKATGGGQFINVTKVAVFAILILAGLVGVFRMPATHTPAEALSPFFAGGMMGVISAMGFTFIALQGFDLIAAIAGEVKAPGKTIPRAMFLSLGLALTIYLPLLLVVSTAGVLPGENIAGLSAAQPETVVAVAAGRFLGAPGYWLVIIAAILSTLSALQANVLAASRVALSMAADRTLPAVLGDLHEKRNTPVMAVYASALTLVAILFMVPDLAAAGAAASLIFLICFTLAHVTTYLARKRGRSPEGAYRTPAFPVVPVVGGSACLLLALFQAVVVPTAGAIVLIWLGLGGLLYLSLFQKRARQLDAYHEARDPQLARLRGKTPLVLLPIANPAHAQPLVEVATALAPRPYGRVLLLTVVPEPGTPKLEGAANLEDAQRVVHQALESAFASGHAPEVLLTVAPRAFDEIRRVAEEHRCESLLLGMRDLSPDMPEEVNILVGGIDAHTALMSTPPGWRLSTAHRVLVPVGGRGFQHEMRARFLGSIGRDTDREVTFFRVLPEGTSDAELQEVRREMERLGELKVTAAPVIKITRSADPVQAVLDEAEGHDLVLMGLERFRRGQKTVAGLPLQIAARAKCATIILSSR